MTAKISAAALVAILVSLAVCDARAQSASDVLKKVDKAGYVKSGKMKMVQTVVTPSGDRRSFDMLAYSENGNEKGLTVYETPSQVRGMKILTLNDGDDIWVYFPRTNRTRKIASSARNRKVQGSDFTYDDMATGKLARSWQGKVIGSEKVGGKECFKLDLKPTDSGPKSYSRALVWVEKADYGAVRVDYFDLDGDLAKRLEISGYRKVSGVLVPFNYTMTNLADGGYTSVEVSEAEVDAKLDPGIFTEAGLSR